MEQLDLIISRIFFEAGSCMPYWLVVFLASYLIWVLVLYAFFVIKKQSENNIKGFLGLILAVSLAYIINIIIGLLFFRYRPFISLGIETFIETDHLDKSFPSSHAVVAFAIASYVFLKYKKNAVLVFSVAFFASIGRVFAGVHYIGDILTGALIGIFCVYAFVKFNFFS